MTLLSRTILKSTFSLLLFLFTFSVSLGQQALEPLQYNQVLKQIAKEQTIQASNKSSKSSAPDTIQIDLTQSKVIFTDDFSGYAGWPTPKKWVDNNVFINNSFGSRPLTFGVATFDGLDPMGAPYNNANPSAYGINDVLTSCPINLSSVNVADPDIDPVHLSFYYQPQGNNPFDTDEGDSLMLEFYNVATQVWTNVWSIDGEPLHPFTKVTLEIDPLYYQNGFQFRFTNFGNQTGNVDHWHLDYVYMTSQTMADHNNIEDMAYREFIPTLLTDYTAMPWWHYEPSDMIDEVLLNYYYFNRSKPKSADVKSWLQVLDSDGAEVFLAQTNAPEFTVGFLGNKIIRLPFNSGGTNTYPTAPNPGDVGFYTYKAYYSFNDFTVDSIRSNDTLINNQVFGSYYAYDDGLPEAGFGVFGTGNMLAYKFEIGDVIDTLTAINMYFSPVVRDRSTERFQIVVWAENEDDEIPGTELHRNVNFDRPTYSDLNIYKGISNFVKYELDQPVIVTGKFYIGWEKITEERMNIGYDVNRNSQENIYINVGDVWSVSDSSGGVVPGSLMMRPVFRSAQDPVVGDEEVLNQKDAFKVYPNPAKDELFIQPTSNTVADNYEVSITDIRGVAVKRVLLNSPSIDVQNLPEGFYIVTISNRSNNQQTIKKVVISR